MWRRLICTAYEEIWNWEVEKLGRSDENEEEKELAGEHVGERLEMKRSRKKTSLGLVLKERLQQVFCHDLAFPLDITVEVYLDIERL